MTLENEEKFHFSKKKNRNQNQFSSLSSYEVVNKILSDVQQQKSVRQNDLFAINVAPPFFFKKLMNDTINVNSKFSPPVGGVGNVPRL